MTRPTDPLERVRRVCESLDARIPAWVHSAWVDELPWLVQGTTTRGDAGASFDLGSFSDGSPPESVRENWTRLLGATGMRTGVHARQVHEADVRVHAPAGSGLTLADPCDGHLTDRPGVLLAVSAADCVPIFLVDEATRSVAALHAGWRGAAAGILERGIDLLTGRTGGRTTPRDVRAHFGPAICGRCYEVGPEVFAALGRPVPEKPTPIDLRRVLAERALARGLDPERISISEHCTRCTNSALFSHRGGDRGRQVGYLGIRA